MTVKYHGCLCLIHSNAGLKLAILALKVILGNPSIVLGCGVLLSTDSNSGFGALLSSGFNLRASGESLGASLRLSDSSGLMSPKSSYSNLNNSAKEYNVAVKFSTNTWTWRERKNWLVWHVNDIGLWWWFYHHISHKPWFLRCLPFVIVACASTAY